jgi:glycosyltransferase involved in cell wall biosynthesis
MDGGSTDGTLDIVQDFDHTNIRVFSEKDEGAFHAITKGFEKARGDYFTTLCGSDGYLDSDWLQLCVDALDSDSEVSLVWGIPALCTEDGKIGEPHPAFIQFLKKKTVVSQVFGRLDWSQRGWVPNRVTRWLLRWCGFDDIQKKDWLFFWLDTGLWFPDLNMCYRRLVYEQCMPSYQLGSYVPDEYMPFYFNFNQKGFLPVCIPRIANFGRTHAEQGGTVRAAELHRIITEYYEKICIYAKQLRSGEATHVFRDGTGHALEQFSCFR